MKRTLLALMLASISATASAGHYFSVDVQRESLKYYDDKSNQSVVTGTYSVDANQYVRLNLSLGSSLSDGELRNQTDTFRQPSNLNSVSSSEYKTTAEVKSRAALSASIKLPVSQSVDAVAHIGVSTTKIDINGYSVFFDHPPTSLPESSWGSLNECQLTGIEDRCSSGIKALSSSDTLSGAFYSAGVDWKVSPSTTVFVGYRYEGDSELNMKGLMASIRFSL